MHNWKLCDKQYTFLLTNLSDPKFKSHIGSLTTKQKLNKLFITKKIPKIEILHAYVQMCCTNVTYASSIWMLHGKPLLTGKYFKGFFRLIPNAFITKPANTIF